MLWTFLAQEYGIILSDALCINTPKAHWAHALRAAQ
jgi:hypothetical protein